MDQCRRICRDDKGLLPFLCKSFHYSSEDKLCLLSPDGPGIDVENSTRFSYHQAVCLQGGNTNIYFRLFPAFFILLCEDMLNMVNVF